MPSLRRLALPLGLSLALHALLIASASLIPSPPGEGTSTSPPGPLLSLGAKLDGPRQRSRPRPRPDEEEITVGVAEPILRIPGPPLDAPGHGRANPGSISGGSDRPPGGGNAGAKSGPPPLLSATGPARRVVYVIDRSMSMGHTGALARARQEVIAAVKQLPPDAHFQVIVYGHFAHHLLPGDWLRPTAETIRAVEQCLADLTASGSTDHVAALRKALALRPDLVFLVTDADDLRPADVPAVSRLNAGRAAIHVVELARGRADRGDGMLAQLARHNGGSHRRVSPDF